MNSSKVVFVAMAFMVAMVIVVRADRDSISADLEDALSHPNGGSAYCQLGTKVCQVKVNSKKTLNVCTCQAPESLCQEAPGYCKANPADPFCRRLNAHSGTASLNKATVFRCTVPTATPSPDYTT